MTREAEHILADTNPSRVYDAAGAARCIEETRPILDKCVIISSMLKDELIEACNALYAGTVSPGGACQSTKDCAKSAQGPVRCEVDVTTAGPPAPICVLDPAGLVGEACLGPGPRDPSTPFPHVVCADGLYCDITSHCQPNLVKGADCRAIDSKCDSALWCDLGHVCAPQTDLGTPCTLDAQCSSGSCNRQTCAPGVPLPPAACGAMSGNDGG
jgi:hypothetical protein